MSGYRPKNFILQELVPPDVFQERGERAWEQLQPGGLITLQSLRDRYGRIVVNNWMAGGPFKESGLRVFNTTNGAKLSMHKYGCAYDGKPRDVTVEEMYKDVLAHPERFPYLTTVENIVRSDGKGIRSWFHFDIRNHSREGIWVVNP